MSDVDRVRPLLWEAIRKKQAEGYPVRRGGAGFHTNPPVYSVCLLGSLGVMAREGNTWFATMKKLDITTQEMSLLESGFEGWGTLDEEERPLLEQPFYMLGAEIHEELTAETAVREKAWPSP